ncbi:MAG TPA: hypothetical protein VGP84_05330, partial [Gemmatimonadaceae bacterium]|nr:hypothetical protein [Gemmatimonadaceae bacterium]
AIVEIETYKDGRSVASARINATVPVRDAVALQSDALLGYFSDATNTYRFGPPKHDVVTARLLRADTGELISEDFQFPAGMNLPMQRDAAVEARATHLLDGSIEVTIRSDTFLEAVRVTCDGYSTNVNYFHLPPSQERRLIFGGDGRKFQATLEALNWTGQLTIGI